MSDFLYSDFDETTKSSFALENIIFRKAELKDAEGIGWLSFERNKEAEPKPVEWYIARVHKQLKELLSTERFHMFVAEAEGKIVGFGRAIRYSYSIIKDRYPAPYGWYLMGMVVHNNYRRRGIGETLTKLRLEEIFKRTDRAYYIVNAENKSSIKLHEKLGFRIIEEGEGFLRVSFTGGKGYLCEVKTT